jgi:hypothetical protein
MKEVTRKIWVSEDGKEFSIESDCRMYELEEKFNTAISDSLFYCDDCNAYVISSAMDLLNFMSSNPEFMDEISKLK